jgi:hypothetical protein
VFSLVELVLNLIELPFPSASDVPLTCGLHSFWTVHPSTDRSTTFVHALVSALLLSAGCRGSWLIRTGVLLAVLALLRFGLHCVLLRHGLFGSVLQLQGTCC